MVEIDSRDASAPVTQVTPSFVIRHTTPLDVRAQASASAEGSAIDVLSDDRRTGPVLWLAKASQTAYQARANDQSRDRSPVITVYGSPGAEFFRVRTGSPSVRRSPLLEAHKAPSEEGTMSKPAKVGPDVLKYILNCLSSPNPERNPGIAAATAAGLQAPDAVVPPVKDVRDPAWPVGNQGRTCACVGWGTADGVLRSHFTKAGKIKPSESLSVRCVWMASCRALLRLRYPPTSPPAEYRTPLPAIHELKYPCRDVRVCE